jgi:hypothetical protein
VGCGWYGGLPSRDARLPPALEAARVLDTWPSRKVHFSCDITPFLTRRIAALDEAEPLLCAEVRFSERPQVFEPPRSPDALRRQKAMERYRTVLGMARGTTRDHRRLGGATVRAEGLALLASSSVNGSTRAGHSPLRFLAREAKRWPESSAPGCVARRISRPVRGVRSL